MEYLYGDSTPSPLKANFLEFIRDALDFCVFVLVADERIKEARAKGGAASDAAEVEKRRLERFASALARAIESAEQGAPASPTAQLAAKITSALAREQESTTLAVDQHLAHEMARIEKIEEE